MRTTVKTLCLLVVLALGTGAAFAGCGVKDTVEGTLKSVDADNKMVTVADKDGKEVALKLTAKTEVTDAEGKKVEVATLVGKQVRVVSEHAQADSIKLLA